MRKLYLDQSLIDLSVYKPVEYLESNGGQFIDTGIQPTDDYGYRIMNTYTAGSGEQCAIGCMNSGNRFVGIYTSGSANAISGAWGSFVNFLSNYTWTTGTILDVKSNYKNSRKIIIDSTEMKDITDIHISGTISNTVYLFARHYDTNITKMIGRVYFAEITNGNTVVASYYPVVRRSDNVAGMYDVVNKEFKTNIGTGSFTVGEEVAPPTSKKLHFLKETNKPLPKGYTEVEYLESTGTQYIDLNYLLTNNTRFEIYAQSTDATQANNTLIGCGTDGSSADRVQVHFGSTAGTATIRLDGTLSNTVNVSTNKFSAIVDIKNKKASINGTEIVSTFSGSICKNVKVALFNRMVNGSIIESAYYAKARVYKLTFYENGTLVRDFIPCLDASNVPCLYDFVTKTAFYNQGTGTFTYGREIHEVDYLESTGTQYIDTGLTSLDVDTIFESTFAVRTVASTGNKFYGADSILTGTQNGNIALTNIPAVADTFYTTKLVYNVGQQRQIYVNGNYVATASNYHAVFPIRLFALAGSASITTANPFVIKGTKITMNGSLVRDFIPAIDENGVGFMFDRVTHTCYLNAGTGTFKYPPTPVEYLEGTGTQYIDTGVNAQSGLSSILDFEYTDVSETMSMLDARKGDTRFYLCHSGVPSNTPYFYYGYGSAVQSSVSPEANTRYLVETSLAGNSQTMKVDGVQILSNTNSSTYNLNVNLYLFGMNYSTPQFLAKAKLYSCKIYNGTLVRDFTPVFKDGVLGMWDSVNSVFYSNAGTGAFSHGKVAGKKPATIRFIKDSIPQRYQRVGYIQSSGTQYIDTNYAFTDNFSWEIDFEGITDGTTLFGGRTSSTRTALLYQRNYGGIDKTTCPIAGYNGQETPFQLEDLRVGRHKIKMSVASNKGSVWVDDLQVYNQQSFTGTYISGTTQALFADKFGSGSIQEYTTSKVYSLKMWQGVNLVRNMVPVLDTVTNKAGMYDTCTRQFYGNNGTGDFTYG